MKEYHKIFIRKYKEYQRDEFSKTLLINLIINIKTHHINVYQSKEFRQHLKSILAGRKSWTGDVKMWFYTIYNGAARKPIRRAYYSGNRLVLYPSIREPDDDLPF